MIKGLFYSLIGVALILAFAGCDDRTTSPSELKRVVINYPKDGTTVGDSLTIKVTSGEIGNVVRIDIFIDGDSTFSDSLPSYEFFWSTHNVTAGENHTLHAVAWTADSFFVSDSVTVMVQISSGIYFLSEFQTTGSAIAVTPNEDGRLLFGSASNSGVLIYDISNPYVPVFVSNIHTTGNAAAVDAWGDYLFIAEGANGVTVWDISDPYTPVSISSFQTPGNAINLEFDPSDSVLYIADGGTMQIVKFDSDLILQPLAAMVFSPTTLNDISLNGDNIHLATANGLRIADIGNPSNPNYISDIFLPNKTIERILSSGNLDYLANGTDGIAIISVAVPSNPVFMADFNTPGSAQAIGFQSGGAPDVIYVADGNDGVSIFRYLEDDSAQIVSLAQFETQEYAYDIIYHDGLIYTADNNRFVILRYVQ